MFAHELQCFFSGLNENALCFQSLWFGWNPRCKYWCSFCHIFCVWFQWSPIGCFISGLTRLYLSRVRQSHYPQIVSRCIFARLRARHPRWTTQRPIKPEIPKKILGCDSWSMAAPLCRVQGRHPIGPWWLHVVTNGGWWLGYWQFYRRPRRCWLFVKCSWNLRPQDVAIPRTIPIPESVSTTHFCCFSWSPGTSPGYSYHLSIYSIR